MATKQTDVKALAEQFKRKYGRRDDETGFEYAVLHVLAQQDPFSDALLAGGPTEEPDLSGNYCGGPKDLQIDGLLFDEGTGTLEIIQAKYHSSTKQRVVATDLEEAEAFFGSFDLWRNHQYVAENGSEQVQELLDQVDFEQDDLSVTLTFAKAKIFGPDDRLHTIADHATAAFAARGLNVSCRAIGSSDLVDIHSRLKAARESSLIDVVHFQVSPDSQFIFLPRSGPRVLTASVKGNEVADLYGRKDVGLRLFNSNIRLALHSGKVNPRVAKTLEDEQEAANFFYYNNGITATCSSFDFDPKKGQVRAEQMQVVNGAQTVNNLQKVLRKKKNPEVYVLLRLIETGQAGKRKNDLADNITRFQNTQNPVRDSDFLSNDPFQLWLRDNLPSAISSRGACIDFWYCNKRGWRAKGSQNRRRVTMEELGMLRHAVLRGPALSYTAPKQLWDLHGGEVETDYWWAFGREGVSCQSWTDEEISHVGWMLTSMVHLEEEHKRLRARLKEGEALPEAGYLKYLARYIVSLSSHGIKDQQGRSQAPLFSEIMSSRSRFDEFTLPVIKVARRLVRNEMETLKRTTAANPRLNLARSADIWNALCVRIIEEIESEQLFSPR